MSDDLVDKQLLVGFFEEAKERSQAIESGLLRLEHASSPDERRGAALFLMRAAHSLKGASGFVEMREIEKACHWMEDRFETASSGEVEYCQQMMENLFAVNDSIAQTARDALLGEFDETKVSFALHKAQSTNTDRQKAFVDLKFKEVIPRQNRKKSRSVSNAAPTKAVLSRHSHESIRIPLSRLDSLLYRSEEILKNRDKMHKRSNEAFELYDLIAQYGNAKPSPELGQRIMTMMSGLADALAEDYRTFETATYYLEREVRRARMQSFKDACVGLARVVRDACLKSGKQAELTIHGDNVEIDQSIVTGMNDILRHLVRNAIDHGIGFPDERSKDGKQPVGQIEIIAKTAGDRLSVIVKDDGKRVPLLKEIAAKRKLGMGYDELEERYVLQELFRPGYSTAASVTELSGRGVGLDIVKRTVERQRGYLEVSLNETGGTTFSIVLPLSLTVTRGLMINVDGQHFAIETATARRLERLPASVIHRDGKKLTVEYHGRLVPALFITEWLFGQIKNNHEASEFEAVMIGDDDNEIAVIVNKVIGEQEIVIRPLGPRISGNRKYNGAATLSNGDMVLILNPAALIDGALGVGDNITTPSHKVLVVDDSPTVRNAHKRLLEAQGFFVDVTVNGAEAWEKLHKFHPDIIVSDIDMPIMDGLTLAEAVRSRENLRDIPIILVTSRDSSVDQDRASKAQVDAFIVKKSSDHDELVNVVIKLLRR
jgi:two-component system chemotaxis sensor kinase CheA